MPYSISKTIKLASRIGGISINRDGSVTVSWDMLDELDGAVESRNRVVPSAEVPDLTISQLWEWADAKVVTEEGAYQAAEAAAIAAKGK